MSDLFDSEALVRGPESRLVIEAVDALTRGERDTARTIVRKAVEAVGWQAVGHRLDVAGRNLTIDADISVDGPGVVDALPELIGCHWVESGELYWVSAVLATWCEAGAVESDQLWSATLALAWLVDRAGFPAEVVV